MTADHGFAERDTWSKSPKVRGVFSQAYRKAWPNLLRVEYLDEDIHAQKAGIDCRIHLPARAINVDEKARSRIASDILLEYQSIVERGEPGWLRKDLKTDFVAYAMIPIRRVWLLPFPLLQAAFSRYGKDWLRQCEARQPLASGGRFSMVTASTEGRYHTKSLAIPISTLMNAISGAMVYQCGSLESAPIPRHNTEEAKP